MKLTLLVAAAALVVASVHAEDIDDEDWDDDDDDGSSLYSDPSAPADTGYDPNDPAQNHRQEGIRRDGEGDWQGALESFQAACRHNPDDSGGCAANRLACAGAGCVPPLPCPGAADPARRLQVQRPRRGQHARGAEGHRPREAPEGLARRL